MLNDFWEFDRKMIYEKYEKIVSQKEETKPEVNKIMKTDKNTNVQFVVTFMIRKKEAPEHGIKFGTNFDNLPEDRVCPVCFSPKKAFKKNLV